MSGAISNVVVNAYAGTNTLMVTFDTDRMQLLRHCPTSFPSGLQCANARLRLLMRMLI